MLGTKSPRDWELDPAGQDAINQANLTYMPPLAGDEGDVRRHGVYPVEDDSGVSHPATWLTLTATQYRKLDPVERRGNFVNDWPTARRRRAAALADVEHSPPSVSPRP